VNLSRKEEVVGLEGLHIQKEIGEGDADPLFRRGNPPRVGVDIMERVELVAYL
jgi:hypothetical protein